MEAYLALQELSNQMQFEPAEDHLCRLQSGSLTKKNRPQDPVIHPAVLPNGKHIRLLKTLQTSACERNCYYCPFRAGRDFRRATLSPDEMARTFMGLQRAGIAEGLFLSSGIAGGSVRTQDSIIATVEILRKKLGFRGYIHLKLMPGAEFDQIFQAMRLADRVSLNLEAPNTERLALLAPRKAFFNELLKPLQDVEKIRREKPAVLGWNQRWPSITTQFVVGAVGESDLELLETTQTLHQEVKLKRAYFSRFSPIHDTPFENRSGASPLREQRLYQASFLLRDYGFTLDELPFDIHGFLPEQRDPKTAWAQVHLSEQPMEINQAGWHELLRIPGIGLHGAKAILDSRQKGKINFPEELSQLGVNPKRALPYILLNGKRPPRQLALI
jgi:predicted DNA-binding helix-hairpin-helix protein